MKRRTTKRAVDGNPNVLELNRNDDEEWLNEWNANPENQWNRDSLFVFLAPKLFSFLPC